MISHNENHMKRLRLKANMTVEEVAAKANVKPETIRSYEQGISRPKITIALQLCEIYQCSLDDIYRPKE